MKQLVQGLLHFQSEVFPEQRDHFEALRSGQAPEACVIACSDSRVDPSLVLSTRPGELFVLRNAGNLVPNYPLMLGGTAASVEFAVSVLKVRDLVVCGHSHCGAMRALLNPGELEGLPALERWLELAGPVRDRVADLPETISADRRLDAVVRENARLQREHLLTHPSVRAAIDRGHLRLHSWVYYFETGEVMTFDHATDCWLSLREWAEAQGWLAGGDAS